MTNRVLSIVSIAVVASSCVADSPLYVTGISSLDPGGTGACVAEPGSVALISGALDLAGASGYQIIASLKSELDPTLDTKADNVTLVSGKHRNTVIIDTVAFTYTSSATATVTSVAYEVETLPVTVVLEPGAVQHVRMPLIGPKAFEAMSKAVPTTNETTNVRVKFQFQGNIISGGQIKSTPITFPISVSRSAAPGCSAAALCPTGACGSGGGQDGAKLVCPIVTPSTDGGTPTSACPAPTAK